MCFLFRQSAGESSGSDYYDAPPRAGPRGQLRPQYAGALTTTQIDFDGNSGVHKLCMSDRV